MKSILAVVVMRLKLRRDLLDMIQAHKVTFRGFSITRLVEKFPISPLDGANFIFIAHAVLATIYGI